DPSTVSPWLEFEPLYHVDVVLLTPKNHPLARQRRVQPRDLTRYPLVNIPHALIEPEAIAMLEEARGNPPLPQLVEAFFVSTVCKYVELCFGIALIPVIPARPRAANLHERVLSLYFCRPTI